ncbi:MAG: exodeoxyribonuclease V subunit gamma, partial [Alphaproteobacteria bacterium]
MLRVEHGNRLEILARELADRLRADPSPPLVPEIVAVPNRGMARWLSFEFADRLGLCASIDFPTPTEMTFDCFRRLGLEVPEGKGTRPEVTTWAIASILGQRLSDPAFAPVANYVRRRDVDDPTSELRLHELSRRLAVVFDQYSVYRREWVLAWERGRCAIEAAAPTGIDAASLESLLADESWQSELWRGLAAKMPATGRHLARLSSELAELLKDSKGREKLSALPKRIFLFGTTSLAPAVVEVLKALGEHVDVTMFLPNPSRQFWGDIRPRRVIERDRSELPPEEGHRLLASLGTHVRDLHESLAGCPGGDHFEGPGWDSLLRQIQSDILDLVPATPRVLRPEDDSVRLHVCHGPMREVEVLHDQLLAMFEENPSLRPRDVVVLAPDIETYAPAVQAVFAERLEPGNGRGHPPLPFTIADRTLSAEQPLVSTFLDLLEIPGSRFEASAVLDLLECAALRQRIGLDDAAVDVAQQWIRGANIRWGIDESTADRLELPRRRENTWRFGFDRLFLGYAMSGSETWSAGPTESPILPYDEVEGTEAMVLGSLSTLFARLVRMDDEFSRPARPQAWSARLSALYADLFSATSDDSAASVQLRQAIKSIGANAILAGYEGEVGLEVVRSELARLLSGPGRSGRFLAGSITFASLQPMRSVPFRVVCLLGMNGDAFPRVRRPL